MADNTINDNGPTTAATATKPRRGAGTKTMTGRVAKVATSTTGDVRRRTDDAVQATVHALDENPFGAIAGAIAVGAVAAALIPASRREAAALGPIARRIREAAEEAIHAAREAGTGELTAAGLTLAAASDGLGGVVGKIAKAATAAGSAAATRVRQPRDPAATGSHGAATTADDDEGDVTTAD